MSEKKKILVIDDDSMIVQVLADKLTSEGFEPITAKDGEEGIKLATSQNPDLILLDLLMPKMGGVEVMEKLRAASDWGKNIPIIIITNVDPDENTVRAVAKARPYYFFTKGLFDLEMLMKKIKERIGD